MNRLINFRLFKGKLKKKFVILSCSVLFALTVYKFYFSDQIQIDDFIEDEDFFIYDEEIENPFFKPPINIFGSNVVVGEYGKAVILPKEIPVDIQKIIDQGFKDNEFNQYVSDLISVNRKLEDKRTDYCKSAEESYTNLPKTSVIIVFHNEAWSTLIRTIQSVLSRSPRQLINEIILVDDYSTMDHLKDPLDIYLKKYPKVRVLRCLERSGLIKARIFGASVAKGPVLTFLDSHVECAKGWLEPLLARISEDSKNVAVPIIDIIDEKTFRYDWLSSVPIGGFDWRLNFHWVYDTSSEENPSLPIPTPTMAGGLFAIDKEYFKKLGMYDPGFDIWGSENLEISFKVWMCGGKIEIIPCSHVGHIFRKKSPYTWRKGVDILRNNCIRLAQVWLDDYAKFFFMRAGVNENELKDVAERKMLRNSLNCHNFKWYLDNIYPTQIDPMATLGQGKISNKGNKKCITMEPTQVQLSICMKRSDSQFFMLTDYGAIRRDNYCLTFMFDKVTVGSCPKTHENTWKYLQESGQIIHNHSGHCLSVDQGNHLVLEVCNKASVMQKWSLEYIKNVHY